MYHDAPHPADLARGRNRATADRFVADLETAEYVVAERGSAVYDGAAADVFAVRPDTDALFPKTGILLTDDGTERVSYEAAVDLLDGYEPGSRFEDDPHAGLDPLGDDADPGIR